MSLFKSGQNATAGLLNELFAALLSSDFTQREAQGSGGTITFAASGTTFIAPSTVCSVPVTSVGSEAFIVIAALLSEDTAGHIGRGAVEISGDTTLPARVSDEFFLETTVATPLRFSTSATLPINPGTNTYTLKYLSANTGSTLTVSSQSILVIAP